MITCKTSSNTDVSVLSEGLQSRSGITTEDDIPKTPLGLSLRTFQGDVLSWSSVLRHASSKINRNAS